MKTCDFAMNIARIYSLFVRLFSFAIEVLTDKNLNGTATDYFIRELEA